jgi:hypothetical protein
MKPKIYYQLKTLRSIWLKSKNPFKKEMLAILDEYIKKYE